MICFRSIFCGKKHELQVLLKCYNLSAVHQTVQKKKMLQKIANLCLLPFGGKKRNVLMEGHKSHFSYFDNELHCFYQYFKIVLLFFACQLKELEDGQVETVH